MSWFKSKEKDDQVEIECPHCHTPQSVSPTIRATFCKGCGKTIYTKNAIRKESTTKSGNGDQGASSKDISTQKPAAPPRETPTAPPLSKAPLPKTTPAAPVMQPSSENQTKSIKCSYCHTFQDVPSIALASFCEKCGRRINLQDYQIRGHFRGELETRGEIRIAHEADVQGNLDVGVAIIEGRMEGEIQAEVRVTLEPNSMVVGTINAPALVVRDGAGFVGKAAINPKEGMESGII